MHSHDPSPRRGLSVDPVIQRTRGDLDGRNFKDDGLGRRSVVGWPNPIVRVTCRLASCGCAAAAAPANGERARISANKYGG